MSAKLKEFGSINSFDETAAFLSPDEDICEIKNYIISISGFGELICFGYGKYLVLASMNSSYSSSSSLSGVSFNICSQTNICVDNEFITSILVLPISSLKQSSQGLPDWTCICVGLSSGVVKFFNEFGQLIHSQLFHSTRIASISVRGSPRHNQPDLFHQHLMILCDNCCYQIDGVYLFESLNTLKKQLIRFQAGFIDDQWDSFELGFKKWLLDPHDIVTGVLFGFETSDTVMDNIFNNVVNKGPFMVISEDATKHLNCVIVGKDPFVAFYKIPLESDSLDMGDLAQAVFSKVKGVLSTSISSWMGGHSSKKPVPKATNKKPDASASEIPTRLQLRHAIDEPTRHASNIIGSPHHNKQSSLGAITDDFGRIFLLDINDGTVLRMWKGYRDAQISISTTCDSSSTERYVNYLTIYSPRRSLIEVWTLPFGDKVASFDVRDRNGRLLHVPHTSLGFSRTQVLNQKVKNTYSTFFLDSTGKISVLDIPFHLSLSSSSSERSQDHLVLKHFKSVIKNEANKFDVNFIQTEFSSSIRLLKLACSVELLMNNVLYLTHLSADVIVSFIDELFELLSSSAFTLSSQEADNRRLRSTWTGVKSLIRCHTTLTNSQSTPREIRDNQNLVELLKLANDDYDRLTSVFKHYSRYNPSIISSNNVSTYLLFVNNFTMSPNSSDHEIDGFQLSKNASEKDVIKIGNVLYSRYVTDDKPVDDIIDLLLHQMKVDQSSCFRLCLSYLINEHPAVVMDNMDRVKELLSRILSPTNTPDVDQPNQFRLIKSSLQLANEMVEKTSNLLTCLLVAMIIRVITLDFIQSGTIEKEEVRKGLTDLLSTWNDTCQRLEDLTVFDCFLKCRPLPDRKDKSKKANISFDRDLILYNVLESGKGIFSERFAKWALKWNLTFSHINELYKSLGDLNEVESANADYCSLSTEVKDIFAMLYRQLPHSLEYDSVLINIAWEYTRLWSQSTHRVEYLENASQLLESIGPAGGLVIQGIGSMIWDMHIVIGLSAMFPIDKCSSQQCSAQLARGVIVNVIRFLNMLIKALENIDVIPTFSTESVWHGDKSRSSLIDMAVTKELMVQPTIELHIQLLYAMQLTSSLNIHDFICPSLFSKETRSYIFKSLTTSNVTDALISDRNDCKLYRMRFLEKCIKSCVKMFGDSMDNDNLCHETNIIIKLLAEKWLIDLDEILQCWILNYYQLGLDSQASMYLDKVGNISLLGVSLLKIIGSRIKKEYLLPDTKYYRECSKYVTPALRRWLQGLDDKLFNDTVITELDKSSILLDQILEWIPENCADFEMATCLQSVILNIQRTMKYIE